MQYQSAFLQKKEALTSDYMNKSRELTAAQELSFIKTKSQIESQLSNKKWQLEKNYEFKVECFKGQIKVEAMDLQRSISEQEMQLKIQSNIEAIRETEQLDAALNIKVKTIVENYNDAKAELKQASALIKEIVDIGKEIARFNKELEYKQQEFQSLQAELDKEVLRYEHAMQNIVNVSQNSGHTELTQEQNLAIEHTPSLNNELFKTLTSIQKRTSKYRLRQSILSPLTYNTSDLNTLQSKLNKPKLKDICSVIVEDANRLKQYQQSLLENYESAVKIREAIDYFPLDRQACKTLPLKSSNTLGGFAKQNREVKHQLEVLE
eukprot:TRINITY_DN12949_c0_g1_i1.p1 TRINITY_DN12949_c0_g1~~TRINITY_DN12949_c0_g1_i1.p1  ORF type:complete len:321 (-),score=27.11 TRINITY_DN12949_c0_g1_i1:235-1197(-)